MNADLVSHDEHVDDTRGSVAPVNQPVALVAQRGGEIAGAKLLVADVVDAGPDDLGHEVWVNFCSWLERKKTNKQLNLQQLTI